MSKYKGARYIASCSVYNFALGQIKTGDIVQIPEAEAIARRDFEPIYEGPPIKKAKKRTLPSRSKRMGKVISEVSEAVKDKIVTPEEEKKIGKAIEDLAK